MDTRTVSGTYLPNDYEEALGRDVVLAPPTCCCCCCCCCTIAVPEIAVGSVAANKIQATAMGMPGRRRFFAGQLAFAAGAVLANILAFPLAALVALGFGLATAGVGFFLIGAVLAIGVLVQTSRLGQRSGYPSGGAFGLLSGFVILVVIASAIAAEVSLVVGALSSDVLLFLLPLVYLAGMVAGSLHIRRRVKEWPALYSTKHAGLPPLPPWSRDDGEDDEEGDGSAVTTQPWNRPAAARRREEKEGGSANDENDGRRD